MQSLEEKASEKQRLDRQTLDLRLQLITPRDRTRDPDMFSGDAICPHVLQLIETVEERQRLKHLEATGNVALKREESTETSGYVLGRFKFIFYKGYTDTLTNRRIRAQREVWAKVTAPNNTVRDVRIIRAHGYGASVNVQKTVTLQEATKYQGKFVHYALREGHYQLLWCKNQETAKGFTSFIRRYIEMAGTANTIADEME